MNMIPPPARTNNWYAGSATNRPCTTPHCADRGLPKTLLIDTIRLAGPIIRHMIPHEQVRRTVDHNGEVEEHFTSTRVNPGDFEIWVRVARDGTMEAVIERSLPTFANGHNIIAVSVPTAAHLVTDLYRRAKDFVEWAVDVGDLRITRLDLVRDFDAVIHLDWLLRGLARIQVPRTGNPSVYSDSGHGGALTLTRGVRGRWRVSIYDKHAQVSYLARREAEPVRSAWLRELADENRARVRYEVQLRSPILREQGVHTMSDLDERILLDLLENYFHRAQFGTPVGGAPHVVAVMAGLTACVDPNYKFFGSVIGMLMAEATRFPQPTKSPTTLARYRKLAKEWGLSAADMAGVAGPPVALDFERGVMRAA